MPFEPTHFPQRWIMCAMCFFAFTYVSFKSLCFYAIADIVEGVHHKNEIPDDNCPHLFANSSWGKKLLPFYLPNYYWNPNITQIADSSYFTGIMVSIVPGAILSDCGYSRTVLGVGMLLMCAPYFIVPMIAKIGYQVFLLGNLITGFGEALVYPSVIVTTGLWSLPSELNLFAALVVAGWYCGQSLGMVLFRMSYVTFKSWDVGSFITGGVGIVWLVFWVFFTYRIPDKRLTVCPHGRGVLVDCPALRKKSLLIVLVRVKSIPWCRIICSPPVISLTLASSAVFWSSCLIVWRVIIPYQEQILHLPVDFSRKTNIMGIATLPTLLAGGLAADWLINNKLMSGTTAKRLFVFVGIFVSSALQITLPFFNCYITVFWAVSITALYMVGVAVPVVFSAPIDLSIQYSGVLMAIIVVVRTVSYLFYLKIRETVVQKRFNPATWRTEFMLCAFAAVAAIVPFMFFGSGEKQNWRRRTLQILNNIQPPESPVIQLSTPVLSKTAQNLTEPTTSAPDKQFGIGD